MMEILYSPPSEKITLVDTWKSFGNYNYRGRWLPTNTYHENDVVWRDLGDSGLGKETYFICRKTHSAVSPEELHQDLWHRYN